MGASGSGKTSSSGYQIGRAAVRDRKIGGLIIASKPEDRAFWQSIFEAAGRGDDLIIFAPDQPHAFNFIDFEKGDARDITACIMTVAETLYRTEGVSRDPFWEQQNRRTIHNAVEVLKRAYGRVDTWTLQRFINGAAISPGQVTSPDWEESFHGISLDLAIKRAATVIQQHDIDLAAKEFWINEWPSMNDKTRSSILAGVMGILHVFNTGEVRERISGGTTISPTAFDEGRWVLVDYPVADHGVSGAFIAGAWKYAAQKHVLRRQAAADTPITVIWCDEFQNHMTSFDAKYLAECRSHYGCMVVLTQSLHSYFSSIGGREAHSQAKGLLTNFSTKIFHSLGDAESAEYASSLIGRTVLHMGGGHMQPYGQPFSEVMGRLPISTSWSQHVESLLQAREFMTGLRTGGADNGFMADAWVVRNGNAFSNGYNHMLVGFSQR
jgi:hypothetical protein